MRDSSVNHVAHKKRTRTRGNHTKAHMCSLSLLAAGFHFGGFFPLCGQPTGKLTTVVHGFELVVL